MDPHTHTGTHIQSHTYVHTHTHTHTSLFNPPGRWVTNAQLLLLLAGDKVCCRPHIWGECSFEFWGLGREVDSGWGNTAAAKWEPGPPPCKQRLWGKKLGSAWLGRAGVGGGESESKWIATRRPGAESQCGELPVRMGSFVRRTQLWELPQSLRVCLQT